MLCLMTRYRWVAALVVLYVLKEGFMAVAGLVMLRRGKKLDGAKWFGKVCTFVFYLVTVTLILWVSIPPTVADILIAVCGAVMALRLRCIFRFREDETGRRRRTREKSKYSDGGYSKKPGIPYKECLAFAHGRAVQSAVP